ncbi:MAG: chemotaxis protein CheB, partial [Isosphaeraceae bacterium]|nr:chemotaxis protein CheB [Isosphaeraceae bacterium]
MLAGDLVIQWNATALDAIRVDNRAPQIASRTLAIMHAAIFDAVNAIDREYQPYRVDVMSPGASAEAAVAAAADRVLTQIYPAQAATFDSKLASSLAAIPDGPAEDGGVALGRFVADQILALRRNDGSNLVVPYTPGTKPGDWRPTPPG